MQASNTNKLKTLGIHFGILSVVTTASTQKFIQPGDPELLHNWFEVSKLESCSRELNSIQFRIDCSLSDQKRGSSKSPDTVSQGGYATNFGAGVGGGGIRGVEGQIMSHTFKPLVTRFVNSTKEIRAPENLVSIPVPLGKIVLSAHGQRLY